MDATMVPSRRRFLKSSAGLAIGAGLVQFGWLTGCSDSPVNPAIPWSDLASKLQGTLLLPGNAGYSGAAAPWALQYANILPGGIARCASVADVQASLAWSQKNDVPLIVRSGGHSYAGFSTTTGLMIDVSQMNQVSFDGSTGKALLQGGARNMNVYSALRAPSVAITHGRCKGVGVAGLVLGGGIGFNMRAQGLTCDQLVETQVVTADGSILTCNETTNQDLFWACRGAGGGNFGIHTSFTFQTFPVTSVTVYQITWAAKHEDIFAALQTILMSAPESMGCKVAVTAKRNGAANDLAVTLLGQYIGSVDDVRTMLASVYAIAAPSAETIELRSYWDGQEFLSEDGTPEYSHERSRYAPAAISSAGIQTIFDNLRAWPGTGVAATWKYFLTGGAITRKTPDAMAFVHRDAAMITSIELEWLASDSQQTLARNEAWLDDFHIAMQPFTSDQCYQNFIDPSETNWQHAYYGANLDRLKTVKKKYDPRNVFHFAQSIPLT